MPPRDKVATATPKKRRLPYPLREGAKPKVCVMPPREAKRSSQTLRAVRVRAFYPSDAPPYPQPRCQYRRIKPFCSPVSPFYSLYRHQSPVSATSLPRISTLLPCLSTAKAHIPSLFPRTVPQLSPSPYLRNHLIPHYNVRSPRSNLAHPTFSLL